MMETGEPGLEGRWTRCAPWHVLQPGAEESPAAALRPCTLSTYCFCSSPWQDPQSTFASLSGWGSSFTSPWHEVQSRSAWGEAFKAAASKFGASPAFRLPVLGPGSWQAVQSSEVGAAASWPERTGASARTARVRRKAKALGTALAPGGVILRARFPRSARPVPSSCRARGGVRARSDAPPPSRARSTSPSARPCSSGRRRG